MRSADLRVLAKRARMASSVFGDFRIYPLPGDRTFLLYFVGEAKLHWAIYYMISLRTIQGEVLERTTTILENIQHRLSEKTAQEPSSSSSR